MLMAGITRCNEAILRIEIESRSTISKIDSMKNGFMVEQREFRDEIKKDFISREEFDPIKKLVYGFVTFILLAVLAAFMAVIIRGGGNIKGLG